MHVIHECGLEVAGDLRGGHAHRVHGGIRVEVGDACPLCGAVGVFGQGQPAVGHFDGVVAVPEVDLGDVGGPHDLHEPLLFLFDQCLFCGLSVERFRRLLGACQWVLHRRIHLFGAVLGRSDDIVQQEDLGLVVERAQGMPDALGVLDVDLVFGEEPDSLGDDDGVVEVVVVVPCMHFYGQVVDGNHVVLLHCHEVLDLFLHLGNDVVDGHLQRRPCDGSRHVEDVLGFRAVVFLPHQVAFLDLDVAAAPGGDGVFVQHLHHGHGSVFLSLLFGLRVCHEGVGLHPAVHLLLHHRHEVVVVADFVEERVTVSGQHLRTEEVLYLRLVELQGAAAVLLLSEVLQDGGFRLSQHRYLFLRQVFRDAVEQDVAVRHLQPSRLIPVDAVHGLCLAGVYVALPCGEGMHGGRFEGDVDDLVFCHQCRHPLAKHVRLLGEVGGDRGRSFSPFFSVREGVVSRRGGDGLGLLLRVFDEGLRRMPCKHLLLGFGEL